MAEEIQTLTIESEDESDELEVSTALIDLLAEEGETTPEVVGDVAMFGLAGRIHAAVHHAQGEPDPELEAAEEATMVLFEERFGMTYGEATGHQH